MLDAFFTEWVEVFLISREMADVVGSGTTSFLRLECLPQIIKMENWQAFISRFMELVLEALNTSRNLHIFYCPQFSGKVERVKGLIKSSSPWNLDYLGPPFSPIVLTHLWETPCSLAGLSLLELPCRRPFLPSHHFLAQTPPLPGYLPYLSLLRSLLCSHMVSYLPVNTLMDTTTPALPRRQSTPQKASS